MEAKRLEIKVGDERSVFARGLIARGFQAEVTADGLATDAPQAVYDEMVSTYQSRHAEPTKPTKK